MYNSISKNSIIKSLFWRFMERGGSQGISFIISLVLARILSPEDYGLIALTTIFISLANVFMQTGLNSALIQKKEIDSLDYSTVFFSSIILSIFLYIILFFSAEKIALFYNEIKLISILRILGLTLFFSAVNSIQIAIVSREMNFKILFFSSIIASILSGVIGLILAYNNYGVWSLVIQQLLQQIISMVVMFKFIKWIPKLEFSLHRFHLLFDFSGNILVAALIDTLYANLRSLLIGKYYTSAMLGFYNRGKQFPSILVDNINGTLQTVMLPAYSKEQEDFVKIKTMMRRTIQTSSYIVFPMMIGLICISNQLVTIVLTEKWLPCIPFLNIYCIAYALLPLESASLQAIKAVGDSKLFLKMEIMKKIVGMLFLILSLPLGVYYIAYGVILNTIFSVLLNFYINRKVFNYTFYEQVSDISESFFLSLLMGLIISIIPVFNYSILITFFSQIALGIFSYWSFSKIFKIKTFEFINRAILNFCIK